ncbi:MAG: flagellar assembly protein FliW, partial [Syntrophaceae bacterium]|nr:flagellar assembly protein FliW [Syntrophaceae bacterium]
PSSPAPEDIVVLSTVTIRSDPFRVTANLRAPIVINAGKMLAKQVVLMEDEYPVQYPLTVNQTALEKKAAEKGTIAPTPLAP